MDINMDNVEYCQTVNIQGMNIGTPNYEYDHLTKNNQLYFQPDICIVRSFSSDLILANIFQYVWAGGLLLWSNLTNNYIAGAVPVNNGSNIPGANINNNNNCSTTPNSIIFLKRSIPRTLKFRLCYSSNSTSKPFDNAFVNINGFFQVTLEFIKFKPQLSIESN